jgi:hypothetical protein
MSSTAIDFSDFSDLIPAGTIAAVQMRIKFGDGTDGVLKRSKDGASEGLEAEYTLLEGPHAKRKFYQWLLLVGTTDGQKAMADKNKAEIRKIIDSAKFLDPNDKSPETRAKRTMAYRDFEGIRFLAEIGVDQGRNGFSDRNVIARVITKDKAEWGGRPPIQQTPPEFGSDGGPAPTGSAGPTIAAAKDLVADMGPIRPGVPVGRLTGSEWGWICSTVVWAWIASRAEQAATEGWNGERTIRSSGFVSDPWSAGAIVSVLPKLFEACPDLDWSQPVGAWSKDVVVEFLTQAFGLIQRALVARDLTEEQVADATTADVMARRMNAAAGNPRMTIRELNDDLPPF